MDCSLSILEKRPGDGLVTDSGLCSGRILDDVRAELLLDMPTYP